MHPGCRKIDFSVQNLSFKLSQLELINREQLSHSRAIPKKWTQRSVNSADMELFLRNLPKWAFQYAPLRPVPSKFNKIMKTRDNVVEPPIRVNARGFREIRGHLICCGCEESFETVESANSHFQQSSVL